MLIHLIGLVDSLGMSSDKERILKTYSKKMMECNGKKIRLLPKSNDLYFYFLLNLLSYHI